MSVLRDEFCFLAFTYWSGDGHPRRRDQQSADWVTLPWVVHLTGSCTSLGHAPHWVVHLTGSCISLQTEISIVNPGSCTSLQTEISIVNPGSCTSLGHAPHWVVHLTAD